MAKSMILGPDGQPIDVAELQEPQTAQLGHLQRELQTHPARGLTPSRLAQILDAAENGDLTAQYDLFEDMEEKDGHIMSDMGKRRRALLLPWSINPPENASALEKRNTEQVAELVRSIPNFSNMLFDVTDAIGKGFACLEIEWHRPEKWWVPKSITLRPQSWFQLHRGYRQELRLRTNTTGTDGILGEALQAFGWIVHTHKAKSGYLERAALFRALVWPYLFKNYSVGDLAEFLEICGIPIRIGKYPPNASDKEKATLLRALVGIGHNAAGIIPEGMLIDMINATSGDGKPYELMINWCERTQSKVILGGTLTSGADGKSSTNALGNVHNEVRHDLRDADIEQVNETITRDMVYAIAALNGLAPGGLARSPRFGLLIGATVDLKAYADALPQLVNLGFQVPVDWAQDRVGIPMPRPGQAILGQVPPGMTTAALAAQWAPAAGAHGLAALTAMPPMPAQAAALQAMQAQLARQVASATGDWLAQVRQLVEGAATLEQIRDGLEQLLPGMSLDQYAQAMTAALQAAQLAGRFDVLQEAAGGV